MACGVGASKQTLSSLGDNDIPENSSALAVVEHTETEKQIPLSHELSLPKRLSVRAISEIGFGSVAKIYLVQLYQPAILMDSTKLVLKVYPKDHKNNLYYAPQTWKKVDFKKNALLHSNCHNPEYEPLIHQRLNHSNIIPFLGCWKFSDCQGILMPKANKTLHARLINHKKNPEAHNPKSFPINERMLAMKKISEAVSYMHDKKITHNDLKPENILFMDKEPKLADFSMGLHESADTGYQQAIYPWAPSFTYLAPEIYFYNRLYSPAIDIFGLGNLIGACVLCLPLTSLWHTSNVLLKKSFADEQFIIAKPELKSELYGLFDAVTTSEFMTKIADRQVKDTVVFNSIARQITSEVVAPCLQINFNERPKSASIVAQKIQKIITDNPIVA